MDPKSTIYFQSISSQGLSSASVRQSYRIPVEPKDNILVHFNGNTFRVTDISTGGICIFFEDKIESEVAQMLNGSNLMTKGWVLIFPDAIIRNLSAKIIRFSPLSDQNWESGIQWVNLNNYNRKKITKRVLKIKQRVLYSDN